MAGLRTNDDRRAQIDQAGTTGDLHVHPFIQEQVSRLRAAAVQAAVRDVFAGQLQDFRLARAAGAADEHFGVGIRSGPARGARSPGERPAGAAPAAKSVPPGAGSAAPPAGQSAPSIRDSMEILPARPPLPRPAAGQARCCRWSSPQPDQGDHRRHQHRHGQGGQRGEDRPGQHGLDAEVAGRPGPAGGFSLGFPSDSAPSCPAPQPATTASLPQARCAWPGRFDPPCSRRS